MVYLFFAIVLLSAILIFVGFKRVTRIQDADERGTHMIGLASQITVLMVSSFAAFISYQANQLAAQANEIAEKYNKITGGPAIYIASADEKWNIRISHKYYEKLEPTNIVLVPYFQKSASLPLKRGAKIVVPITRVRSVAPLDENGVPAIFIDNVKALVCQNQEDECTLWTLYDLDITITTAQGTDVPVRFTR